MAKAPIMPFYTDAFLCDTTNLNGEQIGAYLLILTLTWRNNGVPFPDDDVLLAKLARVSLLRWRRYVRPELTRYFDLSEGTWRQPKLEKTFAHVEEKIEKNSQAGKISRAKALEKRKAPSTDVPTDVQPTINHKPRSINQLTREEKREVEKAVEPILSVVQDFKWFIANAPPVSEATRAQLVRADRALQRVMRLPDAAAVETQVSKLWRHYKAPDTPGLREDYAALLADYPTYVGELAVEDVLRTRKYTNLPPMAELIEKLDPLRRIWDDRTRRVRRLLE
tara:strand:- start:194 stop:1033 length:840 start_codon:yes stop_codon:yes gene_type:complete